MLDDPRKATTKAVGFGEGPCSSKRLCTNEMYFGGSGDDGCGDDDDAHIRNINKNNNGTYWSFEDGPDAVDNDTDEIGFGPSDRPNEPTAFLQSLLDLQGFCLESKRKERRRAKLNASNTSCICLLHQILIKVGKCLRNMR